MVDPNDPAFLQIKKTYRTLEDNYDDLYAECKTDDQRSAFRQLHSSARDAYWKAIADGLDDDNVLVKQFTDELKSTNKAIQASLSSLKDIVAFLKQVTEAVKLAAAIAALAAAA